ncbi:MAG: hypothetical protein R3F13_02290 [Prosthecobacter sp.]
MPISNRKRPLQLSAVILTAGLLCGWALMPASAQETIKIGPLKPLETLPSLSPDGTLAAPPKPKPKEAPEVKPSAPAAAPPALPTNESLVITGPVQQAYLYVEPFQTRFEVLFDAARVMEWIWPGKTQPEKLDAALQQEISDLLALRADAWCALMVRDVPMPTPQPLAAVIKGLPGNTIPMKEGEALALNQAMVGLIWEFGTPPGPDEITVKWDGWMPGMKSIPVKAFFGPLSETGELLERIKIFRWRNLGRLPLPSPLAEVPAFQVPNVIRLPLGGILWLLGGVIFYIYLKVKERGLPGGGLPYFAVWLLGAVLMSQLLVLPLQTGAGGPVVTEVADAQAIVAPLLRNVYRAFDHHVESDVYDVLARSVDGELLRKLYLETIQALTLDGREGTRVTIAEFSATVDKVEPDSKGGGFIADCNWMARGIVGHWGHSHPRVNIYNARVTITPTKGEWKLTGLEVQEVRRL